MRKHLSAGFDRSFFLAIVVLLGTVATPSIARAMDINGIARLGSDHGGDSMVKAYFSNGDTAEINANDGELIALGISFTNEAGNLSMDATLGWKGTGIYGSNQEYEFTRYPLDVLGFYNVRLGAQTKLRIGGGATYIMNPELTASGSLHNGTVNFDDALGAVAQIDAVIRFTKRMGLNAGLRLTSVEYRMTGTTNSRGSTIDGSGAGLFVAFVF